MIVGPTGFPQVLGGFARGSITCFIGYKTATLYAQALRLVRDKDPRPHEFTVQLRACDVSRTRTKLGVAVVAFCTALPKKSNLGGLIVVGERNLGGAIEAVHGAVAIAEIAVEKGTTAKMIPVNCRRQLLDLFDEMATRVDIQFYSDARDALLKTVQE